jgi:transketolase
MLETRLEEKARSVRRQVLEMSVRAGGGHVAPTLSCVDILVALYYRVMQVIAPPEYADRFILSKGHAVAGLYAILADKGFFSPQDLDSFCSGKLCGHPDRGIPGVRVATGSLGHGLSVGAGMAWDAKREGLPDRVYVLLGDGECQEGQVWEAAAFSSHHRLDNLVAIIDRNGLQAIEPTESVMKLEPLAQRWQAFGWKVSEIDGHDFSSLLPALSLPSVGGRPHCVICQTVKGKGVSFMENQSIWHFRIPEGQQLEQARRELG